MKFPNLLSITQTKIIHDPTGTPVTILALEDGEYERLVDCLSQLGKDEYDDDDGNVESGPSPTGPSYMGTRYNQFYWDNEDMRQISVCGEDGIYAAAETVFTGMKHLDAVVKSHEDPFAEDRQ